MEQIFGGATSKERQANAEIYQARVAQELDNLPMAVNAAINTLREAET